MPEPYTYQTNSQGSYDYDVWVFWELYVGNKENSEKKLCAVRPNPGADFTINIETEKRPGDMYILNQNGSIVDIVKAVEFQNKEAGYYVNLSDKANGTYYYLMKTLQGKISGKLLKLGSDPKGYLGIKPIPKNNNHKSSSSINTYEYNAVYEITMEKEGYITLVDTVTIHEDHNPILFNIMIEEDNSIPQHQWVDGYIWDEDLDALSGVNIKLYNRSGDVLMDSAVSNNSGFYEFNNPVPAGTDVYFKVLNDDDYYAYDGSISYNNTDTYEVPDVIETNSDTITDNLQFVMYKKLREIGSTGNYTIVPAQHIRQLLATNLNIEPALRNLKFYLGTSLTLPEKNGYRANTSVLESDIDAPDLFEESSVELNQGSGYDPYNPQFDVGVNVEHGTNKTDTDQAGVTAPLGNHFVPVFSSEMTMNGANYLTFVHEHGRALGYDGVSYYSIMRGDAPAFTSADKVMFKLGLIHADYVYDLGKSYFGLSSLVDNLGGETMSVPYKETNLLFVENKP